jgi:hypothetical protein
VSSPPLAKRAPLWLSPASLIMIPR